MFKTHRSEEGTGLVELIITVAILTVVLGVTLTGFISMQTASAGNNERILDVNEGRLIMSTTTKDLRTATAPDPGVAAFTVAKPLEVEFYSSLNTPTGVPVLVRIFIDSSSRLVETVTTPDSSTPPQYLAANKKQRMVAEYVSNKATDPIFTFYDSGGNVLSPGATGLTPGQSLAVSAVGLKFLVRHDTKLPVAATTLVNRVRLPNSGVTP